VPDVYFVADDLSFRPITDADVPRLVAWLRDPEVGAWWHGLSETYDEAFVHEHVLHAGDFVTQAIVEVGGGPIGFQQWYPLADEPETLLEYGLSAADAAYGIDQFVGESALHGRGLGTRQVSSVAHWLLSPDGPGARRVFTDPVVENARAIRCYEKAGFAKVRVLSDHEELDGEPRDSWLMEYRRVAQSDVPE
jgi:aminoglycoside 6'-N-acetyltransferase